MSIPQEQIDELRRQLERRTQHKPPQISPSNNEFDYNAYARRINADISATSEVARSKRDARLSEELSKWHERVGERFSNAKVQDKRINGIIEHKIANMKEGKVHANSIILVGALGIGKTWTGFAYIERLIREGLIGESEVYFGTESETLQPITSAGYRRSEEEERLLSRRHKLYFIDEVGRANYRDSESRENIWLLLANHAYRYNIPMILTSNLGTVVKEMQRSDGTIRDTSPLENWLGVASMDRLRYMAGKDGVIVPSQSNMRGRTNEFFDSGKTNKNL